MPVSWEAQQSGFMVAKGTYYNSLERVSVRVVYVLPDGKPKTQYMIDNKHDYFIVLPDGVDCGVGEPLEEMMNDVSVEAVYFHKHPVLTWQKIKFIVEREARAIGVVFDGDEV